MTPPITFNLFLRRHGAAFHQPKETNFAQLKQHHLYQQQYAAAREVALPSTVAGFVSGSLNKLIEHTQIRNTCYYKIVAPSDREPTILGMYNSLLELYRPTCLLYSESPGTNRCSQAVRKGFLVLLLYVYYFWFDRYYGSWIGNGAGDWLSYCPRFSDLSYTVVDDRGVMIVVGSNISLALLGHFNRMSD